MFCKLNKVFQDPDIHFPLEDNLPFSDYIDLWKNVIAKTRVDLQFQAEKIIEANAPFELHGTSSRKINAGVLLIHGLLESPFQMHDLGLYLQSQGLLVKAILLPGHGTIPGALLNIHYQQWIAAVEYGFKKLAEEVDILFLIGNSTGAALSLHHFMHHDKVAGIILISPALKIQNPLAPLNNAHKLISWACKRAEWFHIDSEETIDYAKYRSIPFNAVDQVYKLSQEIKNAHHLLHPKCPLFFIVSLEDVIINADAVIRYFFEHEHDRSQLLLYTNKPVSYTDKRIIIRTSVYPTSKIISLSHISLPIKPDNPHYGKQGDFVYASRIDDQKNENIYGEFSPSQIRLNEFLYKYHFVSRCYQRLTFNPDFEFMSAQIVKFINNLIS